LFCTAEKPVELNSSTGFFFVSGILSIINLSIRNPNSGRNCGRNLSDDLLK
jgi:hypothetical protein